MSKASTSEEGNLPDSELFSKLYTYDELLVAERSIPKRSKPDWGRDMKIPEHWPEDTTVDPGTWVSWLPEGWGQGLKVTITGKMAKCFISPPPMKRYFHKEKVEEYCLQHGIPFNANVPAPAPKAEVKSVHDSPPNWPDGDWLPLDFRIGWRQLPSGLHRIYVPPGHDEGFLWHRADVMDYLSQGKTLCPFTNSKTQAAISQEAEAKAVEAMQPKPKKPKLAAASLKDYEEKRGLAVVQLPLRCATTAAESELQKAGVADATDVAKAGHDAHSRLVECGFDETSLMVVFSTNSQKSLVESQVCGFYYQTPAVLGERPCYQKLQLDKRSCSGLACDGLYLFWSDVWGGHWKIGTLEEGRAGLALHASDHKLPVGSAWTTLREDLIRPRTD